MAKNERSAADRTNQPGDAPESAAARGSRAGKVAVVAGACVICVALAGIASWAALGRSSEADDQTSQPAAMQEVERKAAASSPRNDSGSASDPADAKRGDAENASGKEKTASGDTGGKVERGAAADDERAAKGPSGGGSGSQQSGKGSSASAGASESSADSSSGSGKPSHKHSWIDDFESQYVVDEPAWDEPIYESTYWCSACGCAVEKSHVKDMMLQGESGHSVSVKQVQVDTVHHDEKGHFEDVYVGRHCSSCGAKG